MRYTVGYARWSALVDAQGWATAHQWIGGAGTEGDHTSVLILTGHDRYLFEASISGADETAWSSGYKSGSSEETSDGDLVAAVVGAPYASPRISPDGALDVKIDPGAADTDPKFYAYRGSIPATVGDHWIELPDLVAGVRLQGLIYQVEDAAYGDEVNLVIASDGTFPNPAPPPTTLPVDTVLKTYGPRNVPLAPSEVGWSEDRVVFDTSKLLAAGMKVRFKYTNSTATAHRVTVDALVHEPE